MVITAPTTAKSNHTACVKVFTQQGVTELYPYAHYGTICGQKGRGPNTKPRHIGMMTLSEKTTIPVTELTIQKRITNAN